MKWLNILSFLIVLLLFGCIDRLTDDNKFAKGDLPVFNPPAGNYHTTQTVTITCSVPETTIRFTINGTVPSDTSRIYVNPLTIDKNTTVQARAYKANWQPSEIVSADYNLLVQKPVISLAEGTYTEEQQASITCPTEGATIRYTTNGEEPTEESTIYSSPIDIGISTTLKARAFKPGWTPSETVSATYNILIVAAPTFNPPGGTYTTVQNVTINCVTEEAVIRYTTDGNTPTSHSTEYTQPINISSSYTVLKAKAFKQGWRDSETVTANYTLMVANPTFNPSEGSYHSVQQVTINCDDIDAVIRYTTDGTNPTESSSEYSNPISITSTNTTLKARAFKPGWNPSEIISATYELAVENPTLNPPEGEYNQEQQVTINCPTQGATIRYTTNGSEPTHSSSEFTEPINVNSNTTLKTKAFKENWTPSETVSAHYNLLVATPTFSPPGGTYNSPQQVTINCATGTATIRFTTDGNNPTENSSIYTTPISIETSFVELKAKAFKNGWTSSPIASAQYINPNAPPPGEGTLANPYRINSFLNLRWIAGDMSRWNSQFVQTANIDAVETSEWTGGWIPIGNSTRQFTGSYNGNGLIINNLYINRPNSNNQGLFGETSGTTISNLRLTNVNITGKDFVGALIGSSWNSNVVNSSVCGRVTGTDKVGGLIGYTHYDSSLNNNHSATTVSGNENVGGMVGHNSTSSVSNSHNTGRVSGTRNNIGGLIGYNGSSSTVTNCYNEGNVTGTDSGNNIGGLVGHNFTASGSDNSTITGSYNSGTVTGSGNYTGGLVGYNVRSNIVDCYSTVNVSGYGRYTGGLVGAINLNSIIENCYSSGNIIGTGNFTGGLVGCNSSGSAIRYSFSNCEVNGSCCVGGLVGENYSIITNSYSTGNVNSSSSRVGGLIGDNLSNNVRNCFSMGRVTGTSSVGGLFGNSYSGVTSNYWNMQTSGQTTSSGGTGAMGRSTGEMTSPYAANTYTDWDFNQIWAEDINYNKNNGYPYLRWQE